MKQKPRYTIEEIRQKVTPMRKSFLRESHKKRSCSMLNERDKILYGTITESIPELREYCQKLFDED